MTNDFRDEFIEKIESAKQLSLEAIGSADENDHESAYQLMALSNIMLLDALMTIARHGVEMSEQKGEWLQ